MNRIPLSVAIYSSESTPKFIDANTGGNKVLKGCIEKDLVNGSVTFDKVQIKEVTSHFRNGWIFFVVYPKVQIHGSQMIINKKNFVDSQKVKPFILEKVIVKAKKAKEKDFEAQETIFQEENEIDVESEKEIEEPVIPE